MIIYMKDIFFIWFFISFANLQAPLIFLTNCSKVSPRSRLSCLGPFDHLTSQRKKRSSRPVQQLQRFGLEMCRAKGLEERLLEVAKWGQKDGKKGVLQR